MALHSHNLGRPWGLPLSAVLASIPSYPRPVIERLVSRLIDTLDEQDAPTEDMEDDNPREEDDPGEDNDDAEAQDERLSLEQHLWWHRDGVTRPCKVTEL